ncbi:MAG TPA: pyruvate, phosphate dikinase [Candidatus Omnitrophica bacterium]|nr:pyruvate, phosphate dikinase [Candidatus Omnitrophota bacterium]
MQEVNKTVTATNYIYFFANGKADGNAGMKELLGGKGANLAEMTNLGIPVPPGFTISTVACKYYYQNGEKWPQGLEEELNQAMRRLEEVTGKKFGDKENPLLVSVRSGAAISMPGMMDTILNLGLNDDTVQGLIKKTNNPRFAYDAYRRFVQMFGNVVLGIEHSEFEKILEKKKKEKGVELDTELSEDDLKQLVSEFKELIREKTGKDFPDQPWEQLKMAVNAVFASWNNKRAITYREIHKIPHDLGTAVNVQTMVFGNMGDNSGTGVGFTRNPSTGEKQFYGEFLINAQGEDVVAGIRTPEPLAALEKRMPEIYNQLCEIFQKLEKHYRDMQDVEFTIEEGKLYLLQTRTGKRTALAAVNIAVDMVNEGLISEQEAIMRVKPDQLDQLLHPMIDPNENVQVIAKGLPASPGAAVGKVVFSADEAIELAEKGEKVILVRAETSPEDIGGMAKAQGILTARGGMTSHAAVVGRGMGKCCVVGCNDISINEEEGYFTAGELKVNKGDVITLNGTTGEVILGSAKLIKPQVAGKFKTLMEWVDKYKKMGVRANADTPHDAKVARDFGAEGIGLCRTEHMFFGEDRINLVRKMIIADTPEERQQALDKLLPLQRDDFIGIFEVMEGLPVTIRLLDPPLHEFLPASDEDIERVAKELQIDSKDLKNKVEQLKEFNPMLGHRGCRLGISFPEISRMQARAIFEAQAEVIKKGKKIIVEVMIPLVGHVNEIRFLKKHIKEVAEEVEKEKSVELAYSIGTMIEVPRAAITADMIAEEAEFFSFGTNDLTQMGFGFSRDDIAKFLPKYLEVGILKDDPFMILDQEGIGELVKIGIEKGRKTRAELKVGICGEHGGEPSSVEFCYKVGMNYVSCSPYRVPIAKLSAAQAALKKEK